MTGRVDEIVLILRTARHLRPVQVAHRVRLRAQRAAFARAPGTMAALVRRPAAHVWGWPDGFAPLDARVPPPGLPAADLARGEFRFLDEARCLGDPADWDQRSAAQLWRFHLHYFEWAWTFAAHPNQAWAGAELLRLWRSWRRATPMGRGDGWAPYVASLRAWALCGVHGTLVAGSADERELVADLAGHAGFLRAHLELDVGGNHLVKNLKALVGLGVFLRDDHLVDRALRRLVRQLGVQVLADGGHYERSPSYHCQVLGDLIDVRDLLGAASRSSGLDDAISAMRRWLGEMVLPDGDVPLFNDATLVGSDRIAALAPLARSPGTRVVLEPSGYVVVRPDHRVHVVADVGPPSPPELPAHAHADCLSFELAVDGRRTIIDSGTSTYRPGERRSHERSTAAHNTVEVDGADQTEVWGTFRAGRRAEATLLGVREIEASVEVVGTHDGYRRLPGRPRHVRTWRVAAARIEIRDEILGVGRHCVAAWLHLAPALALKDDGSGGFLAGLLRITVTGPPGLTVEAVPPGHSPSGLVAFRFGEPEPAAALVARFEGALPVRITTTVDVCAGSLPYDAADQARKD
jgi:uncharacterized heparinase superfamily protein